MKTTGEFRKELTNCFLMARDGKLSGDALRGVIGCANQINISLSVEMKSRAQLSKEGIVTGAMGEMLLGEPVKQAKPR